MSGSSSILASLIDSISATIGQSLLIFGTKMEARPATPEHPFGFGKESYFWSLIATSVTFLGGSIFMIVYGIREMINGTPYQSVAISLLIIFLAVLLKSFSLYFSVERFNLDRSRFKRTFMEHLSRSTEMSTVSIMMQDIISVLGLGLAFFGVLMSMLTQSAIFDQMSSIVIGVMMGVLGGFFN